MYMAYKHNVHASLEELSQQEASALNCYCELSVSNVLTILIPTRMSRNMLILLIFHIALKDRSCEPSKRTV